MSDGYKVSYEVVVDKVIPSPTIFPYDMTYSYSDSVREYDGLVLATVRAIIESTKSKKKTVKWKTLFFVEDLSGNETSKKVVDLSLGAPEVVFIDDGGKDKIMDMLVHFSFSEKKVVEIFKKTRVKAFIEKYGKLWKYTYELHNLAFHTLFLARSFREKIMEDFKNLNRILKPGNEHLREIVDDILGILAYANNKRPSLRSKDRERVDEPKSVKEVLDEALKNLCRGGRVLVLIFPQMLREEASMRRKWQENVATELVKYIVKTVSGKVSVRVVSYAESIEQAEEIKNKMPTYLEKEVIKEVKEEVLMKKIFEEIRKHEEIIIIILQDYSKKVISKLLDNLQGKRAIMILANETTYDVAKLPLEKLEKDRFLKATTVWSEISEQTLGEISYSKILICPL